MKRHTLSTYQRALNYLSSKRKLPDDFEGYNLKSSDKDGGWLIAHEAARFNCLPAEFTDYHLTNSSGWSVAHEAALYGSLPAGFQDWHLVNHKQVSVLEVFVRSGMKNWKDRASLFNLNI